MATETAPKFSSRIKDPFVGVPVALDDLGLDPYAFRVYCRILRRAGRDSDCFESYAEIAQGCKMGLTRLKEALSLLVKRKLVEKQTHAYNQVVYVVTDPSEWDPNYIFRELCGESPGDSCKPPRDSNESPNDSSKSKSVATRPMMSRHTTDDESPGEPSPNIGKKIPLRRSKEVDPDPHLTPQPPPKPLKVIEDSDIHYLADDWAEFALSVLPKLKVDRHQWAHELTKVMRHTGLSCDEMRTVLEFVKKDDFWRKNAISLMGLMNKSKNGLRKIDNLLANMASDKAHRSQTINAKLKDVGAQSYF